jgi:fibronectin-binding autotransporter adhesin
LLTTGSLNTSTTFSGVISGPYGGSGGLTKVGTGTLTLSGLNNNFGNTNVNAGTLVITSTGRVAGDVFNYATFDNAGTVGLVLYNQAGATGTNSGTMLGAINRGTFTSTGTLTGAAINFAGTMSLQGQLTGFLDNSATLHIRGPLTGVAEFFQDATGSTDLHGFDLTTGSLEGSGTIALRGATLTTGGLNTSTTFAGMITGRRRADQERHRHADAERRQHLHRHDSGQCPARWSTPARCRAGRQPGDLHQHRRGQRQPYQQRHGQPGRPAQRRGRQLGRAKPDRHDHRHRRADADRCGNVCPQRLQHHDRQPCRRRPGLARQRDADRGRRQHLDRVRRVVSGTGGVTKTGTGTLTLSGVNTYTGTTTVSAGTLSNTGTLSRPGRQPGDVRQHRRDQRLPDQQRHRQPGGAAQQRDRQLRRARAHRDHHRIGAVTQTAAGTFALNGFATTIGSLAGAGQVQLGSATLTTGGSNASTDFAGVISGTGGLTKVGTGTQTLSGANTYTGVTTISGGGLQLGNGGPGGGLASSSVVDNGVLTFNRSDLLQLSAAISGTGRVVQAGTGTTQLSGANTYTGGTLVSAGRLVGNTMSLQGAIQTNGVLEFAQATAGTYAGSISGTGAMEKTGIGRLTLTGDSSTFTGATRVLGGQLAVNGLLSRSVVTVGSGGTLMGTGPIGGLVAQSGSFVAPGNSVGTLQVNGNVQFLAGSTYQAEVTSAAADLINATGTAQIAGTLALTNLGGTYTLGTTYVLVNAAGGRTGTFDLTTGLNAFGTRFRPRVLYTATQVQLLIAAARLADLACGAPTGNQSSFFAGFDAAVAADYDPTPLDALYNQSPEGLCRAADQMSGGIYPAAASVALDEERLIREAADDRLRQAQDSGLTGTGAWGHLVGAWGHTNSDGTGFDFDNDRQGVIFGVDTGNERWRAGLFGHHLETDVDADALASEARIERTGFGAYAGFGGGPFRARLGVSYSDLELTTDRTIAFPGFAGSAHGETDGSMLQGFGEIAYRFDLGQENFLEPFAELALANLDLDALTETGTAASRLRVDEQDDDIGRAIAGLRGDLAIETGGLRIRLGADAGAQYNFGDTSVAALIALDGAPQHPFSIEAPEIEPWAFVGGGRIAIDLGSNVTATIAYRGVYTGNSNDHAASGTLSVRF